MLIMTMKANCSLQINLYIEKESYKLSRLINSHRLKRLYREGSDKIANVLKSDIQSSESLATISNKLVMQLKELATQTVGMKRICKQIDYRIISDHPNIRSSRRALMEAKKAEVRASIMSLDSQSIYKQHQAQALTKRLRNSHFLKLRQEYSVNKDKDKDRLKNMSNTDRSKFLHSRIQGATQEKKATGVKATYATMSFEGRRAVANQPDQIQLLLNSYTHYVSMDTENVLQNVERQKNEKRGC